MRERRKYRCGADRLKAQAGDYRQPALSPFSEESWTIIFDEMWTG